MSSPTPDPQRRRPTIADVARRAGVSAAAVSFAVNDRPGVSQGTRARILAAARDLGWQPSASARALTEARTRAVGLVLARSPEQLEGDSFFPRFLSGIGAAAAPGGAAPGAGAGGRGAGPGGPAGAPQRRLVLPPFPFGDRGGAARRRLCAAAADRPGRRSSSA